MPGQDTLPPAFRASDAEREHAIQRLRDESVEGRLSQDTFLHRVDRALRAQRLDELAELLSDLPGGAPAGGLAARAAARWSAFALRVQSAWRSPRLPRLVLPRSDRTVFTIGRAPDSDLALRDMTVSWRHAELRRPGGGWVLADLGSTNGTRVNGWRAGDGYPVRAGDQVSFGRAAFLVAGED
ncbi:MAG: FHA domain-containing protein [Actinobacteria bacterium]|nr:FHA domain-containing protein [Actinomycetota bacterium]